MYSSALEADPQVTLSRLRKPSAQSAQVIGGRNWGSGGARGTEQGLAMKARERRYGGKKERQGVAFLEHSLSLCIHEVYKFIKFEKYL